MKWKFIIYDLETISNCFTAYFVDFKTGREKCFVIHESRNDLKELMVFLRAVYDNNYILVGYNCIGFDAQILEHIFDNYARFKRMSSEDVARDIYAKSQFIIGLPRNERHLNLIYENNLRIPHLDIFKFKHYDGAQKSCSLKWLEFTMRFPNIESMPIHHYDFVTEELVPRVISYNRNDVLATKRSLEINMYEVELRDRLSEVYQLNLMNASEPRMAREIFGKILSDSMRVPYNEMKDWRSNRERLFAKDLIFDKIKFGDKILKDVYSFFEGLDFDPRSYPKNEKPPPHILNNYGMKTVEKVFNYHNLKDVVVGLGGIHACIKPGVYEEIPDKWVIHDIDATSYYPNIGIQNNLFPEHLSDVFCRVYNDLFELRKTIPKTDPVNTIIKLILNSTYGLSKEANNYLYDPKYTFSITINGQLQLLMLAEKMKKRVKSVIFYQFNTDGITIGYDPAETEAVKKVMKEWEVYMKISLEDKFYKKMVIMDVNNYLAVDQKGIVKRKGLFGYSMKPEDKEMDYHKNPSAVIIPKALEAYFVYGVPIRDYILSSKDVYDFCIGVKLKDTFDFILYSLDKEKAQLVKTNVSQKVVRYYVSTHNTRIKKVYNRNHETKNGDVTELESGWATTPFNVYEEKPMNEYGLDYAYYIGAARKIVDQIVPHAANTKLELF